VLVVRKIDRLKYRTLNMHLNLQYSSSARPEGNLVLIEATLKKKLIHKLSFNY
jgi:hypothetical protein